MSLPVLSQPVDCPVPYPAGFIPVMDSQRVQTLHFSSLSVSEGVSLSIAPYQKPSTTFGRTPLE